MRSRDVSSADLDAMLALNNAHAAEVNALTREALSALVAVAARARVIGRDAFLIALDETIAPQGPNHRWFLERYETFLYIDRVVVAPAARGRGLMRALYDELGDARPLCCEVNVVPPNPGSLEAHARLGFVPCGEAIDPRNGKHVRYLLRDARGRAKSR